MTNTYFGALILIAMIGLAAYTSRGRTRAIGSISGRDWIIYTGCSLLVVLSIVMYAESGPYSHETEKLASRWLFVCLSALLSLGLTLKFNWDERRNWRLWTVLAILGALHFTIVPITIQRSGEVPFLLFAPLALLEVFVMGAVLAVLGVRWRPPS